MNLLFIILVSVIILSLVYNSGNVNKAYQRGGGFDLNRQYWCDSTSHYHGQHLSDRLYKAALPPKPDPIKLSKFIDKVTHSVTYADDMTQIGGPYRPPACPKKLHLPGPFDKQDPWRVDQIMCEVGHLCDWNKDAPSYNKFEL
jgi:hypothetical protein